MEPIAKAGTIKWLESTDSTNRALRSHICDYDNLSIIASKEQTAGRGQGTHTWFSSPGNGLTFSILYRFGETPEYSLKVSDAILITQVTTLALRDYLLDKGVDAGIKWPNDIWVDGRKICGILIENTLDKDEVKTSIVGIGININERNWPEELPNPVSLCELTGEEYHLEKELVLIQKKICRRFAQLADADGRISLQEEFGKFMFRLREELK